MKSSITQHERTSNLLTIDQSEWIAAIRFFEQHPDETKMKKSDKTKKHSFIKVGNEIYAMANKKYQGEERTGKLGEGAFGKVKVVQTQAGENFAVKIEGRDLRGDQEAEIRIQKILGFFEGEAVRNFGPNIRFVQNLANTDSHDGTLFLAIKNEEQLDYKYCVNGMVLSGTINYDLIGAQYDQELIDEILDDKSELTTILNQISLQTGIQFKTFKDKFTAQKLYTLTKLVEGKDLVDYIYFNVLKNPTDPSLGKFRKRLPAKKQLTETQKLIVAFKACKNVQQLHHQGIIHADIKPENLMAKIDGSQIIVESIDFGFSMLLNPGESQIESTKKGTPTYMAPEILSNDPSIYSFSSDIYALGVMFQKDLKLNPEIYNGMLADDYQSRETMNVVIAKIVSTLLQKIDPDTNPALAAELETAKNALLNIDTDKPTLKKLQIALNFNDYALAKELIKDGALLNSDNMKKARLTKNKPLSIFLKDNYYPQLKQRFNTAVAKGELKSAMNLLIHLHYEDLKKLISQKDSNVLVLSKLIQNGTVPKDKEFKNAMNILYKKADLNGDTLVIKYLLKYELAKPQTQKNMMHGFRNIKNAKTIDIQSNSLEKIERSSPKAKK